MILLYVHAAPNAQPTRVPYFPQSSIISSAIYITPLILRLPHNSQTHKLSTLLLAAVLILLSYSSSFNPPKVSKMPSEGTANCIDIILAIILPPLGVFLKFGCHVEFWICLLLTIFGYLPGIIYAIYVITK